MADYAIGDLQGCFSEFDTLLQRVDFNPSKDHLYLVGDVVARGPDSLACLQKLYQLQNSVTITLGNHDLHLLACHYLKKSPNPKDKLADLFNDGNFSRYIHFLQQQPLAIWLEQHNSFICHAGLNPNWSIDEALSYARFAEQSYQGKKAHDFFAHMYQSHPLDWQPELTDFEQFRYIVNYFTRMRFVTREGDLELKNKSNTSDNNATIPWFEHPNITKQSHQIIFGHWAALEGKTNKTNIIGLDTGCVWGGAMTLLELQNKQLFSEPAHSF